MTNVDIKYREKYGDIAREKYRAMVRGVLEQFASDLEHETHESICVKELGAYSTDWHDFVPARFQLRKQPKGLFGDVKSFFSLKVLVSTNQFPDINPDGEGVKYTYSIHLGDPTLSSKIRPYMEKLEQQHQELEIKVNSR